ncbi:MAG: class I SAM-dependent methyltransferase [Candidatus Heimdallarchaeaceae archaeon]
MNKYIQELAEYYGITPDEVKENMGITKKMLAETWGKANGDNIEFHKNSEWIIYRMMRDREKINENLREIVTISLSRGDKTILDYGAGVGAYTIPLANLGFDVTAVEVASSKILDFLEWRTKKRYLDVNFTDHRDELKFNKPEDKYDAIIFYDVLEHLSNPFEIIKRLHCALKPKGMLYITYSPHGDMTNMDEINKGCVPFLNKYFYRYDSNKYLHK